METRQIAKCAASIQTSSSSASSSTTISSSYASNTNNRFLLGNHGLQFVAMGGGGGAAPLNPSAVEATLKIRGGGKGRNALRGVKGIYMFECMYT